MSDDEEYGAETRRKEQLRVRVHFGSYGENGTSRSTWMKRNASLFELVPKALELFELDISSSHLPPGAFVEITYHNHVLGGWEGGEVWAQDSSISAAGIRDGLGPRMKVFNSHGQLLLLSHEHRTPRWVPKGATGVAIRSSGGGDTLRPWEEHGLVRLPRHDSSAKQTDA